MRAISSGLAQPGPAEQSRLAAADEWRQEVDHLDPRLEQLGGGRQFRDGRRIAVDRPVFRGIHRPAVVDRLSQKVEHAAQGRRAHRHLHRAARVHHFLPADQAVRAAQRHAPHATAA